MLVYLNNGNGTFTQQPPVNASQMGRISDLVDLNGDGISDYIGWVWSGSSRYSQGNGDGTFGTPVDLSPGGIGYRGDYNGDGKYDYVSNATLRINQGNATFTSIDISSMFQFNEVIWGTADFSGDGKTDVLIASLGETPNFAIFTATGTGFTRANYSNDIGPNSGGYTEIGNYAGNSAPDLIFWYRYQNKKVVYVNDGAGNFTRQDLPQRFEIYNFIRTMQADFDGDGKDDLVKGNSRITNSRTMLADVSSVTFLKNVCNRPGEPRIVDFDGTGNTDWSFWNPATGDWSMRSYVYPGTSGPLESNVVNWGLGSHGDIPTPGDFDGDGVADRAVFRNSDGYWYIRRSSDLVWFVMRFGLTGDKPVAADYDGDTITDIAVWRPSDGNWYIWYMGTQSFYAQHFGSDGDKPVQADFDGDLKTDLAVYRPSTGVWYYYRSSDGNWAAYQWGISTDKPIPADYDGDGKADITIHRDSDHVAYILRSSNLTPAYYQFGLTGDILQIGDYDGDYIADIGVFRPSNNSWWVSSYPFQAAQNFGTAGVVPTSSMFRVE